MRTAWMIVIAIVMAIAAAVLLGAAVGGVLTGAPPVPYTGL